jgi:PAS domain S-box-containing protein
MLPFIQSSYLTTLLESFSAGVVITNTRGHVYAANESAARLLGRPKAELLNSSISGEILERFVDPQAVSAFLEDSRLGPDMPRILQARYKTEGDGELYFTLSTSRLVEYGKVFGIVLQITDVTPIYEMHEREKRILEEKSTIQQERIESLGKLSMGIAHQIRNPLMTIGGFAKILEKKFKPQASGFEFLAGILDGARRLEDIVKAVSEYTSSPPAQPELTGVEDLVREEVAKAVADNPGLAADIAWEIGPGGSAWTLDRELTAKALHEVLLNAMEALAGQENPKITVTGMIENQIPRLEVRDNGPGLAENTAPFVFDPFFTTKAVGVGMGLPKARRRMEEQDGELYLAPAPGGGTSAFLVFPRQAA